MYTKTFVVCALAYCISQNYAEVVKDSNVVFAWDLLIFTQQWPITVCMEWKQHNKSHTCSMPDSPDVWTIHGIWPTRLGTIGPAFCNNTWHFDPEQVKPIESNLEQKWRNIESGTSLYSLWTHEWSKHGTCAAVLPPLNSEFKYFSQGLNWHANYTMTNVLKEANIVPSNTNEYTVKQINDAIKLRLGVNPAIECRKFKNKEYLVEVRICFDKQLKLENCDGVVSYKNKEFDGESIITNCATSLIYPESEDSQPQRSYLELYKLIYWLQWFTL